MINNTQAPADMNEEHEYSILTTLLSAKAEAKAEAKSEAKAKAEGRGSLPNQAEQ